MIAMALGSIAANVSDRKSACCQKFPCQGVPKTVRSERNYMISYITLVVAARVDAIFSL
jgi:hypothetical protein